jgi:hypothetical protein
LPKSISYFFFFQLFECSFRVIWEFHKWWCISSVWSKSNLFFEFSKFNVSLFAFWMLHNHNFGIILLICLDQSSWCHSWVVIIFPIFHLNRVPFYWKNHLLYFYLCRNPNIHEFLNFITVWKEVGVWFILKNLLNHEGNDQSLLFMSQFGSFK